MIEAKEKKAKKKSSLTLRNPERALATAGARASRRTANIFLLPCCFREFQQNAHATIAAMREDRFYKFWVYIVTSHSGTLYTGMTGFIDTRVSQHKSGEIEGFTKKYKCNRLVYYEQHDDVYVAKRRERQIKGWRREKKIALIEKMNPRWEDLAEHWGREMKFANQSIKDVKQKG